MADTWSMKTALMIYNVHLRGFVTILLIFFFCAFKHHL